MQESLSIPHWLAQSLQTLVTLAAGAVIPKIYAALAERKKQAAETSQIASRPWLDATDPIIKMMERLDKAVDLRDKALSERDDLKRRCDLQEIEIKAQAVQMKQMKAYIVLKGLDYSEFNKPE